MNAHARVVVAYPTVCGEPFHPPRVLRVRERPQARSLLSLSDCDFVDRMTLTYPLIWHAILHGSYHPRTWMEYLRRGF